MFLNSDNMKDNGIAKAQITKKYYSDDMKDATKYNKPECVSLLQETETKHDFIGRWENI